uniref:ZP domain-containing protein n=1 Tax=Panagrolaimus sp. JU765 TaxID=591449 RepID=A0AC34QRU0_9BILA
MPICRYEILSDGPTGKPVKYARIGDHVYHKWTCESESVGVYCMKVHSCSVSDGQGGEAVLVLDSEGCEIDRFVLQNLDYSGDLTAGQGAHVFKFADKPSLHFNCQLELSLKDPKSGCKFLQPQCVNKNGVPSGTSNQIDGNSGNNYKSAGNSYGEATSTADYSTFESKTSTISNVPGYGDAEQTIEPYSNQASTANPYVNPIDETVGYEQGQTAEYAQKALPGASFRVVAETTNGYNEFDSGYTTKGPIYEQTQVPPSSRVSESQYEDAKTTSTVAGYDQTLPSTLGYDPTAPQNAALVYNNEFYQDETESPIENGFQHKATNKRHAIKKRKVAGFDLPEQKLIVVDIDEDPLCKFLTLI